MELGKTAHAIYELTALGTPENVAQRLQEKGIQGIPGYPQACPIALYLNEVTGQPHSVAGGYISLIAEDGPWEKFELEEGSPIRRFIHQFDGGRYEGLRRHRS
jgi:hypothetical protein